MGEEDQNAFEEWEDWTIVPSGHRSGFVAVVGRPNVGKSTLINRFLGQKVAIVSSKPQTTRGRIHGILTREDVQVIFVDTPGIHRPVHKLGEVMVEMAARVLPDADVVLFVVDVSSLPGDEEEMIAGMVAEAMRGRAAESVILVLNKMDRLAAEKVKLHTEAYWGLVPERAGWMMTIATEGVNLEELLGMVVEHLPEGPRYYPHSQITDQTEREIAAELVREQVLRFTHQEVPHSVAVVVEEFKERENGVFYVAANIHVERDSQKGIIIGKGGQMLRRIGGEARKEIERMVGGVIYLDLWVKVSKNWRRDWRQIQRLGYSL
jgi:GTP-binding protein Era